MLTKNMLYKNIFHMLCYYVDGIYYFKDGDVNFEEIKSTDELIAVILDYSFRMIRNFQLGFSYTERILDRPHGKINILKSYESGAIAKGQLICESVIEDKNNIYNQIIKSTFKDIITHNKRNSNNVSEKIISLLKEDYDSLFDVDTLNMNLSVLYSISDIPKQYKPIWTIIKFIYEDWLASDSYGEHKLINLTEEDKISHIFEKFCLNLAKKEFAYGKSSNPAYPILNKHGKVWRTAELDHLMVGKEIATIFEYKFYDKTSIVASVVDHLRQVQDYGTNFLKYDKKANKISKVKCVIMYAFKDEYNNSMLKNLEDGESVNDTIDIYARAINLYQDFNNIINDTMKIFNWSMEI